MESEENNIDKNYYTMRCVFSVIYRRNANDVEIIQ